MLYTIRTLPIIALLPILLVLVVAGCGGNGGSSNAGGRNVGNDTAPPFITGTSGTINNGETITVSGTDFGIRRTPDDYDYFDSYTSDWSCNKADGSCNDVPAGEDIAWVRSIFMNDPVYMGQINGNPLYSIDQNAAHYSTGRAFNEWPEYYDGSAGGFPNGSLVYDFIDTDEIFYVYYVYYDPAWPQDYQPAGDKNNTLWSSIENRKWTVLWTFRGGSTGKTHIEMSNEVAQQSEYMNSCPSCMGYYSGDYRSSDPQWPGQGKWIEVKVHLKMNTWTGGSANENGMVQVWIDGTQVIDDNTVVISDQENDKISYMRLRSNWSGGTASFGGSGEGIPAGEERYITYDDVLINYSGIDPTAGVFPGIASVYLSNQSSWGSGSVDELNGDPNFIRQNIGGLDPADYGFKSWSDTQFKFEVNLTGLNTDQDIYLYVTNWDGQTNENGYVFTLDIPAQDTKGSKEVRVRK